MASSYSFGTSAQPHLDPRRLINNLVPRGPGAKDRFQTFSEVLRTASPLGQHIARVKHLEHVPGGMDVCQLQGSCTSWLGTCKVSPLTSNQMSQGRLTLSSTTRLSTPPDSSCSVCNIRPYYTHQLSSSHSSQTSHTSYHRLIIMPQNFEHHW